MARRKSSEDSIRAIKDAAVRLFASRGYANSSLEEVATVAGFTKGAIYYFFKSKATLLADILQDIERRSLQEVEAAFARDDSLPTMAKLATFIDMQARWAARYPDDLAILMLTSIETVEEDSTVAQQVRAIYERMRRLLDGIITEGKQRGEVAARISTDALVVAMMANHDGNMLLWYRSGRSPEVGRTLVRLAHRLFCDPERLQLFAAPAAKARSRAGAG
ncbi:MULTISPECIES: TetR/AcrR family transcriptional regulator [Cupriavidus]